MSKLDDVLQPYSDKMIRVAVGLLNGEVNDEPNPNGIPLKQAIKELMLEILDNTEVLGPLHPQLTIYRDTLKSEINSL